MVLGASNTISQVTGNNGNYTLNTNVGDYALDPAMYNRALFQAQAQKYFAGPGLDAGNDLRNRASEYMDTGVNNLTPQEYSAISGFGANIPSREIGYLALNKQYGPGTSSNLMNQISQKAAESKSRPWYRSAVKAAVPAAIGLGAGVLGGAALAPSVFTGGITGVSAGGTTSGLGSALGNFATDAALSGALRGGVGGLLSGGDLSSALKGAGLGAIGGGYGSALGGSLGLGGFGQNVFTDALTGAAGGLGSGNFRDAGLGALLGGGSSYVMGGGNVPGLGSIQGAPLQGGLQGPTQGSGILGGITRGASSLGLGGGGSSLGGEGMAGNKLGSLLKGGMALYNQGQQEDVNEDIQRRLMEASGQQDAYLQQAQGMFNPYQESGLQANQQLSQALAAGFNPSDLAEDPAYKFRLQQGEQALGRSMAAKGLGQSGAALKAAQEYGQGLAAEQYQQSYNNWLNQNQQLAGQAGQGFNAITNQAGLGQALGQSQAMQGGIDAQLMARDSENRQQTLARLLGAGGEFFGLGSIF